MKNNPVLLKGLFQAIEAFEDCVHQTCWKPPFQNDRFLKMEKVEVDRYLVSSYEQEDMGKLMESLQKYIEVLEENLESHNTLPFQV